MIMMFGMEQIQQHQAIQSIMIDYGDERVIHHQTIDEQTKLTQQIDSDHVQ